MHSIDLVLDCREDKQYAETVPDEVTTIDYRFVSFNAPNADGLMVGALAFKPRVDGFESRFDAFQQD